MLIRKNFFKPSIDFSYSEISKLYSEIAENKYKRNADFVIPQNPKFSLFGNKMAFCQLLNTWCKKNPKSLIRIYDNYIAKGSDNVATNIENYIERAEIHVLLALLLCIQNGIKGYEKKQQDYQQFFKKPLNQRILGDYKKIFDLQDYNFSSEYFQIHPDFFNNYYIERNKFFYRTNERDEFIIKTESVINEITEKLFKRIAVFDHIVITAEKLKELQTYFYEIFDNAFKWGRTDWLTPDENTVEKSNRIFYISSKNIPSFAKKKIDNDIAIDKFLHEFIKRYSIDTPWGTDTKMLELSVLDNGIGIVQTYKRIDIKKEHVQIENEYKFLLDSFFYRKSSDTTSKQRQRGLGLFNVISCISNVFCILRTGHLFLCRDFSTHPIDKEQEIINGKFYLFDASEKSHNPQKINISKHPWAEGTLFTFLIPISIKK